MNLDYQKKILKNILHNFYDRDSYICCICKNKNNTIIGYSHTKRKRLLCRCGARERQRGLLYLIIFFTKLCIQKNINVLHTSPAFELSLIKLLKLINPNMNYITSDIKDNKCDILLNLTKIPNNHINQYDYIINIHLLEHLKEKKDVYIVLNNIYDLLKNNGIAIIAVPQDFNLNVDILEDPNADPNPDHWRKFGNKFIKLLNRFSKIEVIFDKNYKNITNVFIENNIEFKDLLLNIDRNNKESYVDGQVFYLCHK